MNNTAALTSSCLLKTAYNSELHYISFSFSRNLAKCFLNSRALVDTDAHASKEGQTHVLLGTVSQLGGPQNVLPGHQIQQEQHCPTRQMVLKLQVS